ncbi:hypothetical protein [Falsirhodobacter algicola]|uniref:Uncharacterized protein n=1 Tax=Falsirhodobacter algicola TaxID=2692330 RepID=A0A8J8MRE2_9RHOB|nr:hypothetical protein [Falsirhodobacter algicola]QUS35372.1 hypothetical protein GR316_03245 [Falsirhodobacter algicola]
MSQISVGHLYFFAFWGLGIICCFAAIGLAFVLIRALFFKPQDDGQE